MLPVLSMAMRIRTSTHTGPQTCGPDALRLRRPWPPVTPSDHNAISTSTEAVLACCYGLLCSLAASL